jgi:hypothetical protein
MAVFNGNKAFSSKKQKSLPVVQVPKSVKKAFNVDKAFRNGIFKIEPKKKQTLYDRCYLFEDINYINKNKSEQKSFLLELMMWLNSIDVDFKITLANQFQSIEEFLSSIRSERNKDIYPDIAHGIRKWQEDNLNEVNPNVTTLRYLTVACRADSEENARVYFNALESTIMEAFTGWGSRIEKLSTEDRLCLLQNITQPGRPEEKDFISFPAADDKMQRDWKNDILPRSIKQYKNFMIMGDTYVSVLYGAKYRKTIDSDTFIRCLSNVSYPSIITLDFAPVETDAINDKLVAAQMNNDREIVGELEQKQKSGQIVVQPSHPKKKRKQEIENYIDQVDENDEKGFFLNLLLIITAPSEELLASRIQEMQAIGKKEGCILETCDWKQLKAWNTALPIGGRQVTNYMRFFLTSSLVAFQPYHAQDIIEPGGQMLGLNETTKHFIIGNRKELPNPHGIIIGFSGYGKSMIIKLTEISQTLLATSDDILVLDPQNEFMDIIGLYEGIYYDLTPKSGIYLNGFEVSQEVFNGTSKVRMQFVATQTEYAKTLCAAAMKNINVTQEHDSVISRCTERMFEQVFVQKKLKRQPTLIWLREEIKKELEKVKNRHDEEIIRPIYNCLEEYTYGSCDMLAHPSNVEFGNRLAGFGLANVPENNWEAVMVTILHYLSTRMDYNKKLQKATHLIVDEAQVVSKKPGSAKQLNNAVLTFRKFGGIVTIAMQNVTAALSNPMLTELFQNCSYKCFLDQGGVDAKSLAAIQEFSAKEFQALGSGKIGCGVMVWNKKVVLFNARIERENPLYTRYTTNYHEQAENSVPDSGTKQEKRSSETNVLPIQSEDCNCNKDINSVEAESSEKKKQYQLILQIAEMTSINVQDVMDILHLTQNDSLELLMEMVDMHLLTADGMDEGRYRKAA